MDVPWVVPGLLCARSPTDAPQTVSRTPHGRPSGHPRATHVQPTRTPARAPSNVHRHATDCPQASSRTVHARTPYEPSTDCLHYVHGRPKDCPGSSTDYRLSASAPQTPRGLITDCGRTSDGLPMNNTPWTPPGLSWTVLGRSADCSCTLPQIVPGGPTDCPRTPHGHLMKTQMTVHGMSPLC